MKSSDERMKQIKAYSRAGKVERLEQENGERPEQEKGWNMQEKGLSTRQFELEKGWSSRKIVT